MSKRRFILFFMAIALLFMSPTTAYGDIVVEPDNDFYWENVDDCEAVQSDFVVEAEDGFITVLQEPGTGKELAQIPNGITLNIFVSYELNGELWGNTRINPNINPDGEGEFYGWVLMSQLAEVTNPGSNQSDTPAVQDEPIDEPDTSFSSILIIGGLVVVLVVVVAVLIGILWKRNKSVPPQS